MANTILLKLFLIKKVMREYCHECSLISSKTAHNNWAGGMNISNLSYADGIILVSIAEELEELKSRKKKKITRIMRT